VKRVVICVSVNALLCVGVACLFRLYIGEFTAFMYIGAYIGLVMADIRDM
jgi:hypothetical protein